VRLKASYTIELSLLMPVIFYSLILIIFMTFYMHDKCIIEKSARIAAFRIALNGELNNIDIEDKDEFISRNYEEIFEELTSSSLIGKWEIEKDVIFSDEYFTVSLNGFMSVPLGTLKLITNSGGFEYALKINCEFINEVKYMWEHKENV